MIEVAATIRAKPTKIPWVMFLAKIESFHCSYINMI